MSTLSWRRRVLNRRDSDASTRRFPHRRTRINPHATTVTALPEWDVPGSPRDRPTMSFRQLLRNYLLPYKRTLLFVVALQAVQTLATLMLPYLSADLIDRGVLRGDNGHIWRLGTVMSVFALIQIVFAVVAVRYGALVAMGFGRDVRRDLFHR